MENYRSSVKLLAFFILWMVIKAGWADEPIVIVSSEYEPYTTSNNDGSGVVLDIVKESFTAMGREVIFSFYPWARCEILLKNGEAFAAAPYFKTIERSKVYDFSSTVVRSYNRFYFNKNKFPDGFSWSKLSDFRGRTMGAVRGYWYVDAYQRNGLAMDFGGNDLQNLHKLNLKRIDFHAMDEIAATKLIDENFTPEQKSSFGALEKPESFGKFRLMISRSYPDHAKLTKVFDDGLRIIQKNGIYKAILKKYKLPDNYSASASDD